MEPTIGFQVSTSWILLALFAQLSVLAVGGVAPVLPEMMRQVVDVHGYLNRPTFTALYGLAQAAPGPNMLVATVIGLKVAGLPGALAATVGMIGPSSALAYFTTWLWERFRERRWRRLLQAGLVPVTVGLVCAGAVLLVQTTAVGLVSLVLTLGTAVLVIRTRLNPLVMLAGATAIGMVAG